MAYFSCFDYTLRLCNHSNTIIHTNGQKLLELYVQRWLGLYLLKRHVYM